MRRVAALTLATFLSVGSATAETSRLAGAVRKAADYSRKGLQREADAAMAEALSLVAETRGAPSFEAAGSLNDLATLAYARGDLDRAEDLFRRAREAYEAVAPAGDARLATILYNLAGVQLEQGKQAAAESLYRSSLAMREKMLGPDDPIAAEVWNDLGFLLLHQRKYDEAAGWLQKALGVWQESPGSGAYAAAALCNLALVRRLQGSFAVAESLYRRALVVEEQAFGPNHPERATTRMGLAALYQSRGNVEQAVEAYREALALVEKSLGTDDPLAIEIREQLKKLTGRPARE